MRRHQKNFLDRALEIGALQFAKPGEYFTLKSGRKSPFFMNLNAFQTGEDLDLLGNCYAQAAIAYFGEDRSSVETPEDQGFDILFGPAYKGIPLAAATALKLYNLGYYSNIRWCSNRKEAKDHGDAGEFVGATIHDGDRVLIVEDVVTSGTSIAEVVPMIRDAASGVRIVGLLVAVDRQEVGAVYNTSALDSVGEDFGFPTHAIVTMGEVVEEMKRRGELNSEQLQAIEEYYAEYGVKP